jgi:hypothetical protein
MKCSIHENEKAWDVKYMYEAFLSSSKIYFKTTDKCCCEKFELELIAKRNEILKEE